MSTTLCGPTLPKFNSSLNCNYLVWSDPLKIQYSLINANCHVWSDPSKIEYSLINANVTFLQKPLEFPWDLASNWGCKAPDNSKQYVRAFWKQCSQYVLG